MKKLYLLVVCMLIISGMVCAEEKIDFTNENYEILDDFWVRDLSLHREEGMGRINENGEWLIRCGEYSLIGDYVDGIAWACGMDGYGYINEQGETVIPFYWGNATDFKDGLAWVQNGDDKYGCIDMNGTLVLPFLWDDAYSCGEGLSWVRKGKQFQCINSQGDSLYFIDTEYEDYWYEDYFDVLSRNTTFFKHGYALMQMNDTIICINTNGEEVFRVPFLYDAADLYQELSAITVDEKQVFLNDQKDLVIPSEWYLDTWVNYAFRGEGDVDRLSNGQYIIHYPFGYQEGLHRVQKDGRYGYLNANNEVVISFEYTMTSPFSNGLAKVQKNEKFGFVNSRGEEVIPCEWDACSFDSHEEAFDDGASVTIMQKNGKNYLVDVMGKVAICEWNDCAGNYEDGLCVVGKDGLYGYMDTNGELVIPLQWESAETFSEGLAAVCIDGKWGYINTSGKTVVPYQYDRVGNFECGYAWAKNFDGTTELIDSSGKQIIQNIPVYGRLVIIGDTLFAFGDSAGSAGPEAGWPPTITEDNDNNVYQIYFCDGRPIVTIEDGVYLHYQPIGNLLEFSDNNYNPLGFINITTGEVLPCTGKLITDDVLYLYYEGKITGYDFEGNLLP